LGTLKVKKNGKPNNLTVFASKKAKWPKQGRKIQYLGTTNALVVPNK
jgi:hypothetical protein